ncbi:MAG: MFS transporter [Thermomicrobiales bacterium]
MRTPGWLREGPLANRNYMLFLCGAFISAMGSWMQVIAQGWTVLQLSDSAFVLGLLGFVQLAPVLLFGALGGSLADRVDRRKFLIQTQMVSAALAVALAVLQFMGRTTIPILLGIAAGNGLMNALNSPAWMSFIKELVGPEQLRQAVAINSARFNLSRIIGPAIGGWLLVSFGPAACFAVYAVSFIAIQGALFAINGQRPATASPSKRPSGVLIVAKNPQVRAVLIPALGLTILAMPYSNFLPAMARDVFQAGPQGLSILLTATGIGAIVGAIFSGSSLIGRHPRKALAVQQVIAGCTLAAFAWSPSFWLAALCIVAFGAALIGFMTTANATIQLSAEPGTEGRALGLWTIVNQGVVPLGSLGMGAATQLLGVRSAIGFGGLGCLVCGLFALAVAQGLPIIARRRESVVG